MRSIASGDHVASDKTMRRLLCWTTSHRTPSLAGMSIGQLPSVGQAVLAELGAEVLTGKVDLADQIVARINAELPEYRSGAVPDDAIRAGLMEHIELIFGGFGASDTSMASLATGRRRAAAGVPLAALLAAFRIAAEAMWERLAELAIARISTPRRRPRWLRRCGEFSAVRVTTRRSDTTRRCRRGWSNASDTGRPPPHRH